MRSDWDWTPAVNQRREVALHLYPTLSPGEFAIGRRIAAGYLAARDYAAGDLATASNGTAYRCTAPVRGEEPSTSAYWTAAVEADYALPAPVDLSALVVSLSHSARELRFSLAWHAELTELPAIGTVVAAVDVASGQAFFAGVLEAVDQRTEKRGERTLSATVRLREATPWWRRVRWNTEVYPVGTEISVIMRDVLKAIGLTDDEIAVGPMGRWTPHSSMQLADLTAWDMLQTLAFPVLADPFVDAIGRFRLISRDVTRAPDLELTTGQVLSISGSKARSETTSVTLKWLDRNLTKSPQQEQALGQASITSGFFNLKQSRQIWWSDGRWQRAENTHMKVLQSINSGLLPVGDESYRVLDEFHGEITVKTSAWVPTVLSHGLALMVAAAAIPDGVAISNTIPIGRIVHVLAELEVFLTVASIGTGSYEVWGEPYDYVHAINTTEAYNEAAREWQRSEEVLESDYIHDEAHAQQVATHELLYRSLAARSVTVEVVDDPRIEPGDILGLPNGERLYVLDYSRDLSRGSAATLRLSGFQA
jgi:hypothetical protein